jgi:hypothetical protein
MMLLLRVLAVATTALHAYAKGSGPLLPNEGTSRHPVGALPTHGRAHGGHEADGVRADPACRRCAAAAQGG